MPGTVNVTASIKCTGTMTSPEMKLTLYWDGYFIDSKSFSNRGSASLREPSCHLHQRRLERGNCHRHDRSARILTA